MTTHFEATLFKRHFFIKLPSFTSGKPWFDLTDGTAGRQGWNGEVSYIIMIVAFEKMWSRAKQKDSLCENLGALVGGRGGSCGDTVEGAGCTPVQEILCKRLGDMGFGGSN